MAGQTLENELGVSFAFPARNEHYSKRPGFRNMTKFATEDIFGHDCVERELFMTIRHIDMKVILPAFHLVRV